jgi:hypothetical protein
MDRTDLFNEIYKKTNLNPFSLNYLKKDLIERGEFLSVQLESVRKWHKERNTDPTRNPEIGILTNSIIENDIQINIIDDELNRLESEKRKNTTITTPKILAFNNEVIDGLDSFQIIIANINELLFENSNIQQWKQLLKGDILENPIKIRDKVTIKDFKYFIKSLQKKVLKGNVYTDLERLNAFLFKGEKLKAVQIQKVNEDTEPKLKNEIDEIISLLE